MSPFVTYILLSLLLIAVCFFAVWKGGPAERSGASVVLAMVLLERLLYGPAPADLRPILSLCGDALTAAGLLAVTLRYGSLWLGGAMLFYAAQFTLHSFYLVTGRSNQEPLHVVLNDLNFAGILVCLVVGTIIAWRGRARSRDGSLLTPAG
jgi:hypothetical protein